MGIAAEDMDIHELALHTGLPVEELKLEAALMPEIAELNELIGTSEGVTLMWITWKPFRVHVSYTEEVSGEVVRALAHFSRQDLVVHHRSLNPSGMTGGSIL